MHICFINKSVLIKSCVVSFGSAPSNIRWSFLLIRLSWFNEEFNLKKQQQRMHVKKWKIAGKFICLIVHWAYVHTSLRCRSLVVTKQGCELYRLYRDLTSENCDIDFVFCYIFKF